MIYLRAGFRAFAALGLVIAAIASAPIQVAMNKLTGKRHTAIPNMLFRGARNIFGIKVEFNENSAPLETKRPTAFEIKHLGRGDFAIVPELPNTAFMMDASFFDIPVLGPTTKVLAEAAGFIGTRQSQDHKKKDLGQIIARFNRGMNTGRFPEGISAGKELVRFSVGSNAIFYGETGEDHHGNEVKLERDDIAVQGIALRVKEIDGRNVLDNPEDWGEYTMVLNKHFILRRVWQRFCTKSVTLEAYALPPVSPSDFETALDLTNHLQAAIKEINAPDQDVVRSRREFNAWRDEQPHQPH